MPSMKTYALAGVFEDWHVWWEATRAGLAAAEAKMQAVTPHDPGGVRGSGNAEVKETPPVREEAHGGAHKGGKGRNQDSRNQSTAKDAPSAGEACPSPVPAGRWKWGSACDGCNTSPPPSPSGNEPDCAVPTGWERQDEKPEPGRGR
eukprot:363384-Chlamydomonas_euryale.AAC.22